MANEGVAASENVGTSRPEYQHPPLDAAYLGKRSELIRTHLGMRVTEEQFNDPVFIRTEAAVRDFAKAVTQFSENADQTLEKTKVLRRVLSELHTSADTGRKGRLSEATTQYLAAHGYEVPQSISKNVATSLFNRIHAVQERDLDFQIVRQGGMLAFSTAEALVGNLEELKRKLPEYETDLSKLAKELRKFVSDIYYVGIDKMPQIHAAMRGAIAKDGLRDKLISLFRVEESRTSVLVRLASESTALFDESFPEDDGRLKGKDRGKAAGILKRPDFYEPLAAYLLNMVEALSLVGFDAHTPLIFPPKAERVPSAEVLINENLPQRLRNDASEISQTVRFLERSGYDSLSMLNGKSWDEVREGLRVVGGWFDIHPSFIGVIAYDAEEFVLRRAKIKSGTLKETLEHLPADPEHEVAMGLVQGIPSQSEVSSMVSLVVKRTDEEIGEQAHLLSELFDLGHEAAWKAAESSSYDEIDAFIEAVADAGIDTADIARRIEKDPTICQLGAQLSLRHFEFLMLLGTIDLENGEVWASSIVKSDPSFLFLPEAEYGEYIQALSTVLIARNSNPTGSFYSALDPTTRVKAYTSIDALKRAAQLLEVSLEECATIVEECSKTTEFDELSGILREGGMEPVEIYSALLSRGLVMRGSHLAVGESYIPFEYVLKHAAAALPNANISDLGNAAEDLIRKGAWIQNPGKVNKVVSFNPHPRRIRDVTLSRAVDWILRHYREKKA